MLLPRRAGMNPSSPEQSSWDYLNRSPRVRRRALQRSRDRRTRGLDGSL